LGEIRAFCRDKVFIWTKKGLSENNGYYCVNAKNLLNAGEEFVKDVSSGTHKALIFGGQDKKMKDRKLGRAYVVITEG
jgi:hypothetical protein